MTTSNQGGGEAAPVIVRCRSCNAGLVRVWSLNVKDEVRIVRANCPWCGDKSYESAVQGRHAAGCGWPKEDDPTDEVPSTNIDGSEEINGVEWYAVIKASKRARPFH
jgi:hypothetical protein